MDMKKEAKMKMLQELKKMATEMMGGELKGKMDGIKKVTVAAKDDASLKKGLEKAGEMVEGKEMDPMKMMEESSEEMEESPEEEMSSDEEMSPEEMKMKIKELQSKLEMMK